MYFRIILVALLLLSSTVFAQPSEADRQDALKLMFLDTTDQYLHFYETSNFESVSPKWVNGLIHYNCAYSTFNGKGFVTSVIKVEAGKVWQIQRHEGPEELTLNGIWTCINCNGTNFNYPVINEHGLCEDITNL